MFNFVKNGLVLTLLLFMVGQVQADDVQEEQTNQVFYEATLPKNFEVFKKAMEQNGWVTEVGFTAAGIKAIAFDAAGKKGYLNKVPKANQSLEAYGKMFLRFNGMVKDGQYLEVIPFDLFQNKGQGVVGWRLPLVDDNPVNIVSIGKSFALLKEQVDAGEITSQEMQAEMDYFKGSLMKLEDLTQEQRSEIGTILGAVNDIQNGKFTEAMKAAFEGYMDGRLKDLDNRVESIEKDVKQHAIYISENKSSINWLWFAVGVLSLFVMSLTFAFAYFYFGLNKVVNHAKVATLKPVTKKSEEVALDTAADAA